MTPSVYPPSCKPLPVEFVNVQAICTCAVMQKPWRQRLFGVNALLPSRCCQWHPSQWRCHGSSAKHAIVPLMKVVHRPWIGHRTDQRLLLRNFVPDGCQHVAADKCRLITREAQRLNPVHLHPWI